jgi:hypothetical protein
LLKAEKMHLSAAAGNFFDERPFPDFCRLFSRAMIANYQDYSGKSDHKKT